MEPINIKQNKVIKDALKKRFEELKLNYPKISLQATYMGMTGICPSRLSRYFNDSQLNNLSENGILFLCARFGVNVEVEISVLPYNEEQFIKSAKKFLKYTK